MWNTTVFWNFMTKYQQISNLNTRKCCFIIKSSCYHVQDDIVCYILLNPDIHEISSWSNIQITNKANLRDLIAATSLVILLKLDSNSQFFRPCDLEVRWMTSKNNTAPLLYYAKLCASFQIHQWIQTGFVVWKCSIRVKIADFLSRVTLNFGGWSWNKANLRDLIAATGLVILLKLDSNHRFFSLCDLQIQWMTPKNNSAPLLYYIKLCASYQIHQWIQTGVTVQKHPIWVKINFF